MAEKLCQLKKKGGGGYNGALAKEVWINHYYSGHGSGFTYFNDTKIEGKSGDLSATLINNNSQFFTASGSNPCTLTATQKCHVTKYYLGNSTSGTPTITEYDLNVGDTIQIRNTNPSPLVQGLIIY